jgi:metal-dependent amidase/aminoacylase/carboxypeptidase family protein
MKILLLALLLLPPFVHGDPVSDQADKLEAQVIAWRHHFHEHPELSNREFKTAAYIAEYLQGLGLQVQTGVAKTAVGAVLDSGKPGPVVALRADIDGLPVLEKMIYPINPCKPANLMATPYRSCMPVVTTHILLC